MNDNNTRQQFEALQQKLHIVEEENRKLRKEIDHVYIKSLDNSSLHSIKKKDERSLSNISKIVHDIKNPLNNIKLSADLINKTIIGGGYLENENLSRCQTWIKIITDSCNKAFAFLQNISMIEEIESETFKLQKENTSLAHFIQNMLPDMLPLAQEKHINLEFNSADEDCIVAIDKKYFGKAVSNLIANAIKYSHLQGLVNIVIRKEGELVFLEISDKGIGIPEGNLEVIFNKFTKAIKQGTAGEASKGIGLYTAKKIINLHNGQLWVKRGSDAGSTFYIALKPVEVS